MATINMRLRATQSLAAAWQAVMAEVAAGHASLDFSLDGAPHAPYMVSRGELNEEFDAKTPDPADDTLTASLTVDFTSA